MVFYLSILLSGDLATYLGVSILLLIFEISAHYINKAASSLMINDAAPSPDSLAAMNVSGFL